MAPRTHEHWAGDFERFVAAVLAAPARRTPAALLASVLGHGLLALGARGHEVALLVNASEPRSYGLSGDGWAAR